MCMQTLLVTSSTLPSNHRWYEMSQQHRTAAELQQNAVQQIYLRNIRTDRFCRVRDCSTQATSLIGADTWVSTRTRTTCCVPAATRLIITCLSHACCTQTVWERERWEGRGGGCGWAAGGWGTTCIRARIEKHLTFISASFCQTWSVCYSCGCCRSPHHCRSGSSAGSEGVRGSGAQTTLWQSSCLQPPALPALCVYLQTLSLSFLPQISNHLLVSAGDALSWFLLLHVRSVNAPSEMWRLAFPAGCSASRWERRGGLALSVCQLN